VFTFRFADEEGGTVHHRHPQVEDDEAERSPRSERAKRDQPVLRLDDEVSLRPQADSDAFANVRGVVDEQDVPGPGHVRRYALTYVIARLLSQGFVLDEPPCASTFRTANLVATLTPGGEG